MAQSLPSKRIAYVDVPEVKTFDASFVYGFFEADERVSDSELESPEFIRNRSAGGFDNSFIDSINFRRFTPRFVRFSWTPTVDQSRLGSIENPTINNVSIQSNLKKIHNEQTFVTDEYTNVYLQDNGVDEKMDFFLNRLLQEVRDHQNPNDEESPIDILRFLRTKTNRRIDTRFLTNTFFTMSENGYTFLDSRGREKVVESLTDEISQVRVRTQLNNKVAATLLKTTQENTINIFDDEASQLLESANQIQQEATSQKNSTILDGRDYDFEVLEFLDYREVDPNAFDPTVQVIGYVVDKIEYLADGGSVDHDPIIVENPRANAAVDLRVRYGTTYGYTIRTIAFVELQVEDTDSNSVVAISFLISSKPTKRVLVRTEESVAPPPPCDFNVNWCYTSQAARLMWNFPVNPQRDIKKFQVFRRSSILEPFQLIREFDFDNSVVKSPAREFPDPQLIIKLSSPQSYYIDKEFDKDSRYIYAVAAVDAHGFTSGYSIQFEASFNRYTNKIEKKLISLTGAPKAYPNAFLQEDTFVDSIRDSGHKKVKVYFNPEYLNVIDSQNNDLGLLKTDRGADYRLQLINIDLQQQQVVKIKLQDKRTTTEKNNEE